MRSAKTLTLAIALLAIALAAPFLIFSQEQPAAPPVAHPAFPGNETPLGAQVAALLADPKVSRAHWGIAVTAMDGTPIYGHDEGQLFRPASNAKLFTTAAAMSLHGPDAKVKTLVQMLVDPGKAIGGTTLENSDIFDGLIAIIGDGDAFLSARIVPYPLPAKQSAGQGAVKNNPLQIFEEAADAVKARGIKVVRGKITGNSARWSGDPWGETWGRDDQNWGYGAPVTALAVNDNQLTLTVTPGVDPFSPKGGDWHATVKLEPETGFYAVKTDVSTDSQSPTNIMVDHPDGPRSLHVYGHVRPGAPYITQVSITDPPLFAAYVLKDALQRRGITVQAEMTEFTSPYAVEANLTDMLNGGVLQKTSPPASLEEDQIKQMCARIPTLCSIIAEHTSPALADDVVWTMKVSQNLHAEMMLRRLAQAYANNATASAGVWVLRQFLLEAGLDGDDFVFYDGSGLSSHDLVTPRAIAQLLAYATKQSWFPAWKAALPVGGEDGSLASRFANAPLKDHVFAKTGTLGETRALSGYLDCQSGKQVIFSVIVDNHTPVTSDDRVAMDKIVAAIAAND